MKLFLTFAFILLCLLVPVVAAAQTTQVEWDHGANFSSFHTFTWAVGPYPIQDPDASMGMLNAVRDELEAKGVRYVDAKQPFDTFVTYNARITTDPQDSSRRILTLNVRIFRAQDNTIVWTAGGNFVMGDDKEQNRSRARALLAEMFQNYPPAQ